MAKETYIYIVIIILSVLFITTVWPTPYRYDILKFNDVQLIVKTNRFTGQSQVFSPLTGWVAR